jgi:hypothetical protein
LTDDIFEPIENWEEVQSVDMTSMQKLWLIDVKRYSFKSNFNISNARDILYIHRINFIFLLA